MFQDITSLATPALKKLNAEKIIIQKVCYKAAVLHDSKAHCLLFTAEAN